MPFRLDDKDKTFKLSIFTIDELPTWSEIIDDYYDGIYKKEDYIYKNSEPGELDKYWKISKKKLTLARICNQFNKMILEDGYKESLLKFFNSSSVKKFPADTTVAFDVRFAMRLIHNLGMESTISTEEVQELEQLKFNTPELLSSIAGTAVPVYTFKHPDGKARIFTTPAQRIDVLTITEDLCIYPIIKLYSTGPDKSKYHIYTPLPWIDEDVCTYKSITEWMMTPYTEYFTGDSPGWKDEHGNIVQKPTERTLGYDQAL